jgi:NADPH:quinone reductase-like Zn-dependent oxidoreductase
MAAMLSRPSIVVGRFGWLEFIAPVDFSQRPEFKADMATLFGLLRDGAIHPIVIDRLPLAAAREVHTRIDAGGLGGKIVLMPWPAPLPDASHQAAAAASHESPNPATH